MEQQWRAGILLPRWAVWANHGYGEPRFIFYPPLSWCLGAALGLFLPWAAVPATFIAFCLVLSGISMFRLARAWLSPAEALAAAVLYAANPYQLVVAYVRSDFSELLAASLLPLAIHYAFRCALGNAEKAARNSPASVRSAVPLAVVFGGIWLTNAPAAVIASYALAFLLLVCAILCRSFRPLFVGLPALALGLMLAAVYIVPAAHEQAWVNIGQINAVGFLPAENFLFTRILDPEHNLVNLEISGIAVLMVALAGAAAVVSHRRAKLSKPVWTAMVSAAAAAVFLMFPVSSLVWRYLPEFRFLQFPWRWLFVLAVCFALFLGESVTAIRRRWIAAAAYAVILAATGVFAARITYWDSDDLNDVVAAVSSGQGYDGTYEYCPFACDPARLLPDSPAVALLPSDSQQDAGTHVPAASQKSATLTLQTWQPQHKTFRVDAPVPMRALLRLLDYPAWAVRVNGVPTVAESDPDTGQMLVPVPAGKSSVEVRFVRTADRTMGGALSSLAALLVSGLAWFGWRRSAGKDS